MGSKHQLSSHSFTKYINIGKYVAKRRKKKKKKEGKKINGKKTGGGGRETGAGTGLEKRERETYRLIDRDRQREREITQRK